MKTSLRIAYFLNSFPQLSETFVLNEILELQRQGHEVRVYALKPCQEALMHESARSVVRETVCLEHVERRQKLVALARMLLRHPLRCFRTQRFVRRLGDEQLRYNLRQSFFLADEILREGVDHIHVHFALQAAEYAVLVGMLTGKQYSVAMHAVDIYVHRRLLLEKMRFASFLVTVCEYNKRYLLDLDPTLRADLISIVRVGVDPKSFSDTPRSPGRPEEFHIVSVARLVEKKGFSYLIEAMARLRQLGIGFRASFAGDGPEGPALREAIRRHGLETQVRLLGAMEAGKVRDLLCTADAFVLPCVIKENGDRDATPTVLGEAMAAGVPVVSTTVAGIPEVVPPTAGILVPPRDVDALADAIRALQAMGRAEREAMGERGREHVAKHLNLETETAKLAARIRASLAGNTGGPTP